MLEAIRKFVLGRGKDVRQSQPPVVGENGSGDMPDDSGVPLQSPEPQSEETADPPVRGQVKWFNPSKGYGFVQMSDGTGDVFLHGTVLGRIGLSSVQPGETLEVRVAPGQRGSQVIEVLSVDSSTAVPSRSSRAGLKPPSARQPFEAGVQEAGTVKWYNARKGFGFVVRDSGGKDVFVHASALQLAGLASLNEGQRVLMGVVEGRKGPEAASIQLA
jgi:CspA family cold shock protein